MWTQPRSSAAATRFLPPGSPNLDAERPSVSGSTVRTRPDCVYLPACGGAEARDLPGPAGHTEEEDSE